MHVSRRIAAATALFLGLTPLVMASPAASAAGDHFVVDTQFFPGQSVVTAATGVFGGCSLMKDLGAIVIMDGDDIAGFIGGKRLTCPAGAKVVLEYEVAFDAATSSTEGTWTAVSSTLDGVEAGDGGPLSGTRTGCTIKRYSGACITDTFTLD